MFEFTIVVLGWAEQSAALHPPVEEQGTGGWRWLKGSSIGATPVFGCGEIVPCQSTPPTTLIMDASSTAPPLPSNAADGWFEFTYIPHADWNLLVPFW